MCIVFFEVFAVCDGIEKICGVGPLYDGALVRRHGGGSLGREDRRRLSRNGPGAGKKPTFVMSLGYSSSRVVNRRSNCKMEALKGN